MHLTNYKRKTVAPLIFHLMCSLAWTILEITYLLRKILVGLQVGLCLFSAKIHFSLRVNIAVLSIFWHFNIIRQLSVNFLSNSGLMAPAMSNCQLLTTDLKVFKVGTLSVEGC